MDEKEMPSAFSYVLNVTKFNNSKKHISIFIEALKKHANRDIEETVVYKALNLLLTETENKSAFSKTLRKGKILYRARKVDFEKLKKEDMGITYDQNGFTGYDEYNSKEPPIGISPDARNSVSGSSYLYLAEDDYTAVSEIVPSPLDTISVARFQTQRKIHLVDFSTDSSVGSLLDFQEEHGISASMLITLIMQKYSTPVTNIEDYIATQYISDVIRKMGYDAVKYRSSRTPKPCITLFNCHETFVKYIDSKLVFCETIKPIVYDVNNRKCLTKRSKLYKDNDYKEVHDVLESEIEFCRKELKKNSVNNGK